MNDRLIAQPVGGHGRAVARHCIADAFRLRGQLGYEIPRDSLKEWLRRGGKTNTLMPVALQLPRVRTPILLALETLSGVESLIVV